MKLKEIYNKYIPLKGFRAMTICPYVFVRKELKAFFTETARRHETTHALQQIEVLVVGILLAVCLWLYGCGWYSLIPIGLYFELYALEWLIKLPFCLFDRVRSYMSIAFEQEAYEHQAEFYYNDVRRHFVWVKYLFTLTPKRK